MKNPHDVIVKALISEKGSRLREDGNKYLFEVRRDANKIEIRNAVQAVFDVHVERVRTLNVSGKLKRMGRYAGRRADWKKAVVTLREGENIELFDQV